MLLFEKSTLVSWSVGYSLTSMVGLESFSLMVMMTGGCSQDIRDVISRMGNLGAGKFKIVVAK